MVPRVSLRVALMGFVMSVVAAAIVMALVIGVPVGHSRVRDSRLGIPSTARSSNPRPRRGDVAGLTLAHPIVGQETSLAASTALVNFPVPQADVASANPSNLTSVWVNHAQQQLALVYGDGNGNVTVVMSPALYIHGA